MLRRRARRTATTRSTGRRATTSGARTRRLPGGAPLLSWTAPNPRTLAIDSGRSRPNPGDDPLAVDADQSKNAGDEQPLVLPPHRRPRPASSPASTRATSRLVNWPSIDYFLEPRARRAARGRGGQRSPTPGSCQPVDAATGCRPRRPGPTAAPGSPACGSAPTSWARADGLAQAPYHRESRRIQAVTTVTENDVSYAVRGDQGARGTTTRVGVGMYRIDLHPSTGGDTYIDVPSTPFEIPLGALHPATRRRTCSPANKNIGTTHITNGCYRLHPVEWNIGEAAGHLAALLPRHRHDPARGPGRSRTCSPTTRRELDRRRRRAALARDGAYRTDPTCAPSRHPDQQRRTMTAQHTAAVAHAGSRGRHRGASPSPSADAAAAPEAATPAEPVDLRMTVWTADETQLALFQEIADALRRREPGARLERDVRDRSRSRTTRPPSPPSSPAATPRTWPGSSRATPRSSSSGGALVDLAPTLEETEGYE